MKFLIIILSLFIIGCNEPRVFTCEELSYCKNNPHSDCAKEKKGLIEGDCFLNNEDLLTTVRNLASTAISKKTKKRKQLKTVLNPLFVRKSKVLTCKEAIRCYNAGIENRLCQLKIQNRNLIEADCLFHIANLAGAGFFD